MFCTIETFWFERGGGDLLHGTAPECEALCDHDSDVDNHPRLARPAAPARGADRQVHQVRDGRAQEASRSFKRPEVLPGCRLVLGLTW
jgi:hypothetical protein